LSFDHLTLTFSAPESPEHETSQEANADSNYLRRRGIDETGPASGFASEELDNNQENSAE